MIQTNACYSVEVFEIPNTALKRSLDFLNAMHHHIDTYQCEQKKAFSVILLRSMYCNSLFLFVKTKYSWSHHDRVVGLRVRLPRRNVWVTQQ